MMFLKDFLEKWAFGIGVAIITIVSFLGLAATTKANTNVSFSSVKNSYDARMNNYFNGKLEKLVEMVDEDEKFFTKSEFKAPVDANGVPDRSLCTPENVSSYCVSMGAVDLYMAYIRDLTALKGTLDIAEDQVINDLSVQDLLGNTNDRNDQIDREIREAEEIMEATMAAYNEFRMAYPMHVQYEQVIDNLVAYRRSLRDLQVQVNRFPGKFINTTTLECR